VEHKLDKPEVNGTRADTGADIQHGLRFGMIWFAAVPPHGDIGEP
jgi:hypothetical protein